jgi:predicted hotdog family 3-hydroxylacyl-ACP dehydratase
MSMPPATLNSVDIALRVPHKGSMCLLDSIRSWSEDAIFANAIISVKNNPLMIQGKLDSTAAIEYAAQAMAVHGALLGELGAARGQPQRKPLMGFLASVRNIVCHKPWLHDASNLLNNSLRINATRTAGTDSPVSYDFSVYAGEVICVSGKATVVLNFE